MAAIYINGNLVTPASQCEGGSQYQSDASGSQYILIHVNTVPSSEQHQELSAKKVRILKYVGPNTYLCFYPQDDLSKLRDLGFVEYANVYSPDLVVNNSLKAKCELPTTARNQNQGQRDLELRKLTTEPTTAIDATSDTFDVFVMLHEEVARTPEQIKEALVSELHLDAATIEAMPDRLRMKAKATDLQHIARIDEVDSIQEVPELQTLNYTARTDIGMVDNASLPTGVGLTEYTAQSVIVAVGDTGFDIGGTIGTAAKPHAGLGTRIRKLLQENSNNPTNDDVVGHGTHVCGSVACNLLTQDFNIVVRGTAPAAELIVQSMNNLDGSLQGPGSLESFLDRAWAEGARIHTNSWGPVYQQNPTGSPSVYSQLDYTAYAVDVDKYMYKRPESLVLFAAGNDQSLRSKMDTNATIGGQATAKNCLTVGACESSKTMDWHPAKGGVYRYSAAGGDEGDKDNVAEFSNVGPTRNTGTTAATNNSRNKPDLVAPGCTIYSTRSQRSPLLWMVDNSKTPPTTQPVDFYGDVTDTNFIFSAGTSMATPLVAGCAAILRKLLLKNMAASGGIPSGALIKALLINSTDDLHGSGSSHGRGPSHIQKAPDVAQGFGRVNLATALRHITDTVNHGYVQAPALTMATSPGMFKVTIPAPTPKQNDVHAVLTATICYNDPPGGATDLVNVLNLHAKSDSTSPNTLYANTGSATVADGKNNVQKLVWEKIAPGPALLVVTCDALRLPVKYPNQDYALVWSVEYVKDTELTPLELGLIAGGLSLLAVGAIITGLVLGSHH